MVRIACWYVYTVFNKRYRGRGWDFEGVRCGGGAFGAHHRINLDREERSTSLLNVMIIRDNGYMADLIERLLHLYSNLDAPYAACKRVHD